VPIGSLGVRVVTADTLARGEARAGLAETVLALR
jgi:hypothetical protein